MTNREVLARKSNEDLAKWLDEKVLITCESCAYYGKCCNVYDRMCKRGIQQWLEQEAEDDE